MRLSILAATLSVAALCGAMPTVAWAADDAPAANGSAENAPDITVTARRRAEDLE